MVRRRKGKESGPRRLGHLAWGRTAGTPKDRHTERRCPGSDVLGPKASIASPQVRSSIPVSHIRAVERVDEGAFQLQHVMQVVTQDGAGTLHTTYLQCKVRSPISSPPPPPPPRPDALIPCRM
jgi:hypothetical protein